MGRPKLIVKRCDVEIAQRERTCKRTGEKITKGTVCIVVYDAARDRACYSREVGHAMITLARQRLDEIERQLLGGST